MGIAAFLLLVVGCSGGVDDCRELPVPAPFYESAQHCEHDGKLVVAGHEATFDHIFGACAQFDARLLEVDAEIVWDVSARDGLTVSLEPVIGDEVLVARHTAPDHRVHRN